nr:hypothetical protein [Tanacetum cinerariifolium]
SGYVAKSDPKEDPEEYEDDETEDGPVDYPMDGGDNGDNDDGDSSRDDVDDEDGDEEDDEEEEEKEHLALAGSAIQSCLLHHLRSPTLSSTPILSRGGYFGELTRSYQMEVLCGSSCTDMMNSLCNQ